MKPVSIRIQDKNSKDKPLIPEIENQPIQMAELTTFCILEGGTVGGNTSISLHVKLDNGSNVIAQSTGKIFEALMGAWVGAHLKWGLPANSSIIVLVEKYREIIMQEFKNMDKAHVDLFVEKLSKVEQRFAEYFATIPKQAEP